MFDGQHSISTSCVAVYVIISHKFMFMLNLSVIFHASRFTVVGWIFRFYFILIHRVPMMPTHLRHEGSCISDLTTRRHLG